MRKHFLIAGMLVAAALVFAVQSKADTVEFTLTGSSIPNGASFALPLTFTPTAGTGPYIVANSPGTFLGNPFIFPYIEIGLSASGQWAFGSDGVPNFPSTKGTCGATGTEKCPYLGIFAPNLFTVNADGTITLNPPSGPLTLFNIMGAAVTLTTTVIPDAPVGTPEPATMALLGLGGLALAGLRRRKAA
jgi:PEP-CTERM motif